MSETPSDEQAQKPLIDQPLLAISDVMEWLQMSRAGVWRLIKQGKLTAVYLDRRPRFVAADVEALIQRCRSGGPS